MITSKNITLFKKSLESISGLIQETNVRFKDEGIYIKSIDKTQIILVDFFMPKAIFDNYSVDPSLIGLNIFELNNMISRSFESDKLKLELGDNQLDISLTGTLNRKFNLSYIDVLDQEVNVPEMKYSTEIVLKAYLLKEILKDVSLISSTLTFKVIDDKFIVEAIGEKGKIETNIPKIKLKSKKNIFLKFSLSYLKNILKSIDNDTEITLRLEEDAPLYIEYYIDNLVLIKIYLSSMLI
jgi:proliferating cell nuclear antigen PCNA